MLMALSANLAIGQENNTKNNPPFLSVSKSGDTVVNNLPISYIVKANVEHEKYLACQEDLDSCYEYNKVINQVCILHEKNAKLSQVQIKDLKKQKTDLESALQISQNDVNTLQGKLRRSNRINDIFVPWAIVTTITTGAVVVLHFIK
jgi:hypothetical protein